MPDDLSGSLDRKWADETLESDSHEALIAYLRGNASPTWDMAVFCSDKYLPKLIEAVIVGASILPDEDAEELVMATLRGLHNRFGSDEFPEALGAILVRSIRLAADTREKGDGT